MPTLTLAPHPRLYLNRTAIARLRQPIPPQLRPMQQWLVQNARNFAKSDEVDYPRNTHNELLSRARTMLGQVITLLARWAQTGDPQYRSAVIRRVEMMHDWEYWSWITWRQSNSEPTAIFDLSYGENSATLAIAYDWLHDSLSPAEKELFYKTALKWSFASFLKQMQNSKRPWWFGREDSNWNTVCAGGAGMLALAMHEDLPQARQTLPLCEQSIAAYMLGLKKNAGAWPEGVGYWNYGFYYAFMYLLSHENATGKPHPLLRQPATRQTLYFPLDFCPNQVPCSFGDVNAWSPMPFHFAVAQRLKDSLLLQKLCSIGLSPALRNASWPVMPEALMLLPAKWPQAHALSPSDKPLRRIYRGQDWAVLADRQVKPTFYLSIRGGTTEVPHGHLDLTSFHCVVGNQPMIVNLGIMEYLDTTFSARRYDLFETRPESKNVVLINGVGIVRPASVKTRAMNLPGALAVHIDASQAYGTMRDGALVNSCHRLFVLLKIGAGLILDSVVMPHVGRIETRMHTYARVKSLACGALLKQDKQCMKVLYACNVPAQFCLGAASMTRPGPSPSVFRWCSNQQHEQLAMATLLLPGRMSGQIKLKTVKNNIQVIGHAGNQKFNYRLSFGLRR